MKENLKNCIAYLEDPTNEASWIVKEHNWKRQKTGIQTFVSVAWVKRQSKLEVPVMSSQEEEVIHCMAAMALYKLGEPLVVLIMKIMRSIYPPVKPCV